MPSKRTRFILAGVILAPMVASVIFFPNQPHNF
jgi:hypothetical protein